MALPYRLDVPVHVGLGRCWRGSREKSWIFRWETSDIPLVDLGQQPMVRVSHQRSVKSQRPAE